MAGTAPYNPGPSPAQRGGSTRAERLAQPFDQARRNLSNALEVPPTSGLIGSTGRTLARAIHAPPFSFRRKVNDPAHSEALPSKSIHRGLENRLGVIGNVPKRNWQRGQHGNC